MRRRERPRPSLSAHHPDGRDHVVRVVERLAHAHEHDVRHEAAAVGRHERAVGRRRAGPVADPVPRDDELRHDLGGGQVAHEALRAGVAERAGEGAADLARDAQRAAIDLRNVDALDLGALVERTRRGHADEPLARAVLRDLLGDDRRAVEGVDRGERAWRRPLPTFVMASKVAGAAQIDPVPELGDAHLQLALGHADRREPVLQFVPGQPDEGPRERRRRREARRLLDRRLSPWRRGRHRAGRRPRWRYAWRCRAPSP